MLIGWQQYKNALTQSSEISPGLKHNMDGALPASWLKLGSSVIVWSLQKKSRMDKSMISLFRGFSERYGWPERVKGVCVSSMLL